MAFIGSQDLAHYAKLDAELTRQAFWCWASLHAGWLINGPFEFETRRRSKPKYGRGGRRKRARRNALAFREDRQFWLKRWQTQGCICWSCGW